MLLHTGREGLLPDLSLFLLWGRQLRRELIWVYGSCVCAMCAVWLFFHTMGLWGALLSSSASLEVFCREGGVFCFFTRECFFTCLFRNVNGIRTVLVGGTVNIICVLC